jgi:hypothetical protein
VGIREEPIPRINIAMLKAASAKNTPNRAV